MNTNQRETALRLFTEWFRMWNDDPAIARQVVAPRFRLHLSLPLVDPSIITDPESVCRWVTGFRQRFTKLVFTSSRCQFFDEQQNVISGPWIADTVMGGVAKQSCGIDILRIADGKVCEYWTLSNQVESVGEWTRSTSEIS